MNSITFKRAIQFFLGYAALTTVLLLSLVALDLLPRDGQDGKDGAPGVNGTVETYIVQMDINATPSKNSGIVACKSGDLVIGGGGYGGQWIRYSYPASKSTWFVEAYCAGCMRYELSIYAICARQS
jgi:hypothetical protein